MRLSSIASLALFCASCGGSVRQDVGGSGSGGTRADAAVDGGGEAIGKSGPSSGGASDAVKDDSGPSSGGASDAVRMDGGTGGAAVSAVDAGTPAERARACDHWFSAQSACVFPAPPADVLAELTRQFESSCLDAFGQPGASHSAADVEACAVALAVAPCGSYDGPPRECDLRGALPANAPCSTNTQCESGACDTPGPLPTPGGIIPRVYTCGTCSPVVGIGESCNGTRCPAGATCMTLNPNASVAMYNCVALSRGDVGESCDGLAKVCKPGLYCDHQKTKRCLRLGNLGESCSAFGDDGCVQPLLCAGTPPTCQRPGNADAPCANLGNAGCGPGFACSANEQCEPVEWVAPGEACDGVLSLCRLGSCPTNPITGSAMNGNCPNIVADGASCTATDTCEPFSECMNTTAAPGVASGRCMPMSSALCR